MSITSLVEYAMSKMSDAVFAGGHACWTGLQQRIVSWITNLGSEAVIAGNVSQRWDWDSIRQSSLWTSPAR